MSNTKDEIVQEVRAFFKTIRWKKILTFSFFVLLSSIFWIIQVYRQKFETTLTIPIKYTSVPDSIIFENELPAEINVRIKDDGAALFKYYLLKRNDSLNINIRDIIRESQGGVIPGNNFGQMIRGKLLVTSELISYTPARISYTYAVLSQKKLPVIYDGYINLSSGYLIDGDLRLIPDSVFVYGSQNTLDTLQYIHTVSDTISGITSNSMIQASIRYVKGAKFVPNKVQIHVPVDEFTLKEVFVPIECINLPEDLNIKFFPSSVKVPFYVGLRRFKDITEDNFVIKIDYNEIKDLKTPTVPVRILESPDYIRTKVPIPSEVEFVLEQE